MSDASAHPSGLPAARASLDPVIDIEEEILRLKSERNAMILAHYYQQSEIQDLGSPAAARASARTELSRAGAGPKTQGALPCLAV